MSDVTDLIERLRAAAEDWNGPGGSNPLTVAGITASTLNEAADALERINHPADDVEALARQFHETYERLAPQFGYETRADTKAFDPDSPNGKLMIAVCSALASIKQTDAVEAEPVAWLYTSDDGSRDLFLDCNHERAHRLIEMGWTEQPLFAAAIRGAK